MKHLLVVTLVFALYGCAYKSQPKAPINVLVDTAHNSILMDVNNVCPESLKAVQYGGYRKVLYRWDKRGNCWAIRTLK
jgi:predicted DCC family thiol-disulfide oxidoreductase YuxK